MRGSIIDLIPLVVIMGVAFIGLLFGSVIYTEFANSGSWPTTEVGNISKAAAEQTLNVLDYGALLIMIGIGIAVIISAFFIKTHPIFFIVSIIVFIIVMIISAPLSNAFMEFATHESLATEAAKYDISTQIIGNLPIIMLVIGVLIIVALYAKPSGSEGGGV